MRSHEAEIETGAGLESETDDKKILVLTPTGANLSKADRIRGVTRSLVSDALDVLDDMWEDCQGSPALAEKYYLLRHYLGYLKRFSEGRA